MNIGLDFMDTGAILQKVLEGEKLFPEEAVHLCTEGDLSRLALAARQLSSRLQPHDAVGFTIGRTVIYSNVCQPNCPFCTGTVTKDHPAAFTRGLDEIVAEVAEAVAAGATQITLQGGHRIDLPWEYYVGLVSAIHERFPQVQLFAFSPSEVMVFNVVYHKRTAEVIAELKAAGMGGLMAGGSEGLNTRGPEYRALLRNPWNEWFDVVHRCNDVELPIIAPFVFGLGESARERIGHLYRVRAVQDRTGDRGRPAFQALSVFTLTPPAGSVSTTVQGQEYLRMVALARLLVPNVPHVQSSFVDQGAKVAQVALAGGADDMGSTHLEFTGAELAAGRTGVMTADEMERLIRDAGARPLRRRAW